MPTTPIEGNSAERMEHTGKSSSQEIIHNSLDMKGGHAPNGAQPEFQSDPLPMKADMSPLEIFEGTLRVLKEGDYEHALKHASKKLNASMSVEEFKRFYAESEVLSHIQTFDLTETKNEATATLNGTVTTDSGKVYPTVIRLIKDGESWQIDEFDFQPDQS